MTRYYHAMKCRYSVHEDRLYRRRFTLLCDQLRLVYQPHIGIGSGLAEFSVPKKRKLKKILDRAIQIRF